MLRNAVEVSDIPGESITKVYGSKLLAFNTRRWVGVKFTEKSIT